MPGTFEAPAVVDLTIKRGDDASRKIVLNLDGAPLNVSGGTMRFTADDDAGGVIGPIVCTVGGGSNNEITIPFTPTETATVGNYHYDIEHETAGGEKYTYIEGTLEITDDVTDV